MAMATGTLETDPGAVGEPYEREEEKKPGQQLYRFSTWVHVGPGAEDCEAVDEEQGTNDCSDPLHFHAWCRLPNPFQHRTMREKGLAAKARKVRQLRDADTDAGAILEQDLDRLARRGDDAIDELVDELLQRDWWKDYLDAAGDVREIEEDDHGGEGEPAKKFAHIEDDQRRFDELKAIAAEERPEDEYLELGKHIAAYQEALKQRQDEIRKPKEEALRAKGVNGLLDLVRDERIEAVGTDEFMHVYSKWEWLYGTLRGRAGGKQAQQVWTDLAHMEAAAPEVIEAIKETFNDLERTKQQGASGN